MRTQDTEHIQSFLVNNPKGFEWIYSKYHKPTFSLLLNMLKDKEEAKDALQEVFIIVYNKLHTFKQQSRFSTWLYSIAYRLAIKKLKNPMFSAELLSFDKADEADSEEIYSTEALMKGLQLLNTQQRMLLELFYYQDQSIRDISAITGQREGNIKVLLHRSRMKLKEYLLNNKCKFADR